MISLFKKLIEKRKEEITLLFFDEDNPHRQENYTLHPGKLFLIVGGLNFAIVLLVMFIFFITPLGTLLFNKENRAIRSSVLEVRDRIQALQDTLQVRDQQLLDIQQVFRSNTDTTFEIRSTEEWETVYGEEQQETPDIITYYVTEYGSMRSLHSDQIIHSDIFSGKVLFLAEPPVIGSLTGEYHPERGHYGIDIAAKKGADVRSIADGVIVSSEWTIRNGYVLLILHSDGYSSVYKHFSEVFYKSGDIISKGDIIGKVGETGILASGPHIHFELWKNGLSLDPMNYINLY